MRIFAVLGLFVLLAACSEAQQRSDAVPIPDATGQIENTQGGPGQDAEVIAVSYTHLRAHET